MGLKESQIKNYNRLYKAIQLEDPNVLRNVDQWVQIFLAPRCWVSMTVVAI